MSSKRSVTPLRLRVEHSPLLRRLYLMFYLVCVVALLLLPVMLLLRLVAVAVVSMAFYRVWQQRSELGGDAVELILRANGSWLLEGRGQTRQMKLHGQSTVSWPLLSLYFVGETPGEHFEIVLWHSEQPLPLYRRLQVHLRHYASDGVRER